MIKFILRQTIAILILILCSILYFNCDDSGVTPPENNSQFCISGQISGWTYGTNKALHANIYSRSHHIYSIANCPIDAQGNFNLCLPESISDTALMVSDSIFYSGCTGGTVTFNPPDVKGVEIYSFRIKSGDTTIGSLKKKNYTTISAGSFEVWWVYTTKNVTVTGTKLCASDTLRFDGTAAAGWTKFVKNWLRYNSPSETILYNTIEPAGAQWIYFPFNNDVLEKNEMLLK